MKAHLLAIPVLLLVSTVSQAGLVLSEIDLTNDKVEIINTSASAESLNGFYLCNLWQGTPAYIDINSSMIVAAQSSTTTLSVPAGGLITLQLTAAFVTNARGEMGLYKNANGFGDSANMQDYVSWGGDAFRDDVAAVIGIWAAGTSVSVTGIQAGQTIQLKLGEDGNSFSDYDLAASTIGSNQAFPPPPPNFVISEIDLAANKLEIINTGAGSGTLSGYWLCNLWQGDPVYIDINSSMIVAAQSTTSTLTVPAGGLITLQLTAAFVTDARGEMGLYKNANSFGDSANMQDYVSWGGDAFRDDVAAVIGIWAATTSVSVTGITAGQTIQLKAGEDGNSFTDYELAASTIGAHQVPPPPPPGFQIQSLSKNGSGDLVITFTTGGVAGPFKLTSSNDLASPFVEETHAVYNAGAGTFTVPAAFVRPVQDFYRVETPP